MSFPTLQKIVLSESQQVYSPQDEITIMIDGNDISLLNGKNSYLRCSVKLDGNAKANLDRNGGGGFSMLETVSIWTGDGSTLLEQLQDMPCYMGTRNFYDKTEGLDNMRQLLEGVSPSATGGIAAIKSPYFNGANLGEAGFTWVELCLPFYMSGVLYGDNAFPCIATGSGLMIKIQLASAQKCIQTIGTWGDEVAGFVQPRLGGSGVPVASDLPAIQGFLATGAIPAGEPSLPSNINKCFELQAPLAAAAGVVEIRINEAGGGQPAGIAAPIIPANLLPTVPAGTDNSEFPWVVGQHVFYLDDAGIVQTCGAITGITYTAPYYAIAFAAFTSTVTTVANHNPVWAINNATGDNPISLTYAVRDVQLVCSVVQPESSYFRSMMARMKSSSGYEMDIKTFSLYRNNLFKGQVKTQQLIPTTEYRARSLLQLQIDPLLSWTASYYRPINDYLADYQYNIASRLIPQLAVNTNKEVNQSDHSWNAEADAERIKCLEASKIDVKSELHPSSHFVFGREVATRGFSSNLNSNEVRLTQSWGVSQPGVGVVLPQKDKLLYTYVRHFRKLSMRPGNTVVAF